MFKTFETVCRTMVQFVELVVAICSTPFGNFVTKTSLILGDPLSQQVQMSLNSLSNMFKTFNSPCPSEQHICLNETKHTIKPGNPARCVVITPTAGPTAVSASRARYGRTDSEAPSSPTSLNAAAGSFIRRASTLSTAVNEAHVHALTSPSEHVTAPARHVRGMLSVQRRV